MKRSLNDALVHILIATTNVPELSSYELGLGDLAPLSETFCPLLALEKYPFNHLPQGMKKKVWGNWSLLIMVLTTLKIYETYFTKDKIYDHTWDL